MGFTKPSPQPVEPKEFIQLPLQDRLRILSTNWVVDGFGTPRVLHVIYILKLVVLYAGIGILIATSTSDVGGFTHVSSWWDQAIIYQKVTAWTMLLEVVGLAGAWGPLCGHFKPMTGNSHYWLRPGTLRLPPWGSKVPLTRGDHRTGGDVVLYIGVLASLVLPLVIGGHTVSNQAGGNAQVVPYWAFIPVLVLMPLLGLRDKVIFLAGRSEQYLPILAISAIFQYTDMIIGFKMVIVVVWIGAGVSKFGHHFVNVVPPMVSNSPFVPFQKVRTAHYRNFPDDIRPSNVAWFMGHILGTTVEIVLPLVLLFSTNKTVTLAAVVGIVSFHLFITSTFPLAVPLEWNIFFVFAAINLFVGHSAASGFAITDISNPLFLLGIAAVLLFGPVLGNLRPDLVSFLPSMRQYAGNWATSIWALGPGVEKRLDSLPGPANNQVEQLIAMGYEPADAEMTIQKVLGWRAMHSQGRGHYSLMYRHLNGVDRYTLREGEFLSNALIGFNFGDGHMHDERLVEAVQRRLNLAPGELVVTFAESQPIHKNTQAYRVIDAALGVVERGTWLVKDAVVEQPWLPNGPIPLTVSWTHPDYVRGEKLAGAVK